jgi:hypothetical protein
VPHVSLHPNSCNCDSLNIYNKQINHTTSENRHNKVVHKHLPTEIVTSSNLLSSSSLLIGLSSHPHDQHITNAQLNLIQSTFTLGQEAPNSSFYHPMIVSAPHHHISPLIDLFYIILQLVILYFILS